MPDKSLTLRHQILILALLTIASFTFRLVPYFLENSDVALWFVHWGIWGANPVLAMFLLCVVKGRSPWFSWTIPLLGFIVTDLIIYQILQARGLPSSSLLERLEIYALFIALSQLGWILRKLPQTTSAFQRLGITIGVGMLGSLLFFLISNLAIWLTSLPTDGLYYYPPDFAGLFKCFTLALPFFQNQFMGDIAFVLILFSAYGLFERYYLLKAQPQDCTPTSA